MPEKSQINKYSDLSAFWPCHDMQFGGRRSNNSIGGCQRCLSPFTVRLVHVRVLFRVSLCSLVKWGSRGHRGLCVSCRKEERGTPGREG